MKKFLLCLLAIVMLVPLMAACENGGDGSNSQVSGTIDKDQLETEIKDMGGKEFRILCHDFQSSIVDYTGEILYAEDESATAVDDAKKWVVDQIEALYNCDITGELMKDDAASGKNVNETIKQQVLSSTDDYHVVFDKLARTATLVPDNIMDLNSISTIDLSKPWWDQNAVKDLSIGGKVYFTCGDVNTYDNNGTWCVLFNKDMAEKHLPGVDLYGLVNDNQWTYDKFVELCTSTKITHDSTGDGVLDEKDTWAFGTETYNIYIHLVSAGEKIAVKDDEDLPYLTLSETTEKQISILTNVIDFYNDNNTVMVANGPIFGNKTYPDGGDCWSNTVHKAFVDGRELFYMCGLIHVASFREMADDFGILPVPKYDKNQDNYYHSVSMDNCSMMSIPSSFSEAEAEDIGLIVSAVGELSMQKVTPEYYEVQLKTRYARDDASEKMLDIIFSTRSFDLGTAYNWGSITHHVYMSLDTNVQSKIDTYLSSAETALEDTLGDLLG